MKHILGLDIGTNSIGWSVLEANDELSQVHKIVGAGSRVIPMDAGTLSDFDKGNTISQTAERTKCRATRRLFERAILRRERLHRVLRILKFLPEHYEESLDRYGKFIEGQESKIAWVRDAEGRYRFLFDTAFKEMLAEFQCENQVLGDKKIPYDWTIYYLRKKALSQKVEKEELAWILLNFNQKRGYNQLRDDIEEDDKTRSIEYHELKVERVEATEEKKGRNTWYNVYLENGWIYRRQSAEFLNWEGKIKPFIVTTDLNTDGSPKVDKNGDVKRSISQPKDDDWTLIKKKTEKDITQAGKTIGEYIFDVLLSDGSKKIRGGLVRTIDRCFYKNELKQILSKQEEYHPELRDRDLYLQCIEELYGSNDAYRNSIAGRDFSYLLIDNILFYQRPLKTKKHLISDCQYECRYDTSGSRYGVKGCPKSHPLFAEFRIWQFIDNLRIYEMESNQDATSEYLTTIDRYVDLFEFLYPQESITQSQLLRFLVGEQNHKKYRWNYVDKSYPCNETHAEILKALKKCDCNITLTPAYKKLTGSTIGINEEDVWHMLYSIDNHKELEVALRRFGKRYGLPREFAEILSKVKPFDKEYAAYSLKAIKRLLPLMRRGRLWDWNQIDASTKDKALKIMAGEYDESIPDRVREKLTTFETETDFAGMPLWQACYLVYNRHSEASESAKWESPTDIRNFVAQFKQHSMRNPIVEKVVLESMRMVADIWEEYKHIDEIHLELGREMKNPADKRKKITDTIAKNEATNIRIKRMLWDFMNPEFNIENVKPESPSQQDLLKIYEESVVASDGDDMPDEIKQIRDKYSKAEASKRPTRSEALRYKLWLEQRYRSPYTGKIIPLGKLFTPAYEIEHVIPQSRYFDDSLSNKIICESEVNKLKDNQLAHEFIVKHHGQRVQTGGGYVEIFEVDDYERFVKDTYGKSPSTRGKMKKLMLDEIPDGFIERQLNDTRYISRFLMGLLSNIVRDDSENEAVSKHLIVCSGSVTDRLKKDWGLNDKWNEIILPRFERMNKIGQPASFTYTSNEGKTVPCIPLDNAQGFTKKRIDHRHHALDAIVIACATRNHINLLNNESALSKNKSQRYDLQRLLRNSERKIITRYNNDGEQVTKTIDVFREFRLPWATFPQEVFDVLNNIIVSFKTTIRVINKSSNKYERFVDGKKQMVAQTKGDMFVPRKPLHKGTVYGRVNLKRIKELSLKDALKTPKMIVDNTIKSVIMDLIKQGYDNKRILKYFTETQSSLCSGKIKVYYFSEGTKEPMVADRKKLVSYFSGEVNPEKIFKKIDAITDTGIQTILRNHLAMEEDTQLAFSPEGIDRMNENIMKLNGGKFHQPIRSVRVSEPLGLKTPIGDSGQKATKYVEAEKGTNLFCGIYINEVGKRTYETISYKNVVFLQEQGLPPVADRNANGDRLLFVLSVNDLVYVPTSEELESRSISQPIDISRIYKTVSFTGRNIFFIQHHVAKPIIDKMEFSSMNKMEKAISDEMIKEICVPVKVDSLGRIKVIPKL